MDVRLKLNHPTGGAPIYCKATWTASGIVLNSIEGSTEVSSAYLPVYNPNGGPPSSIAVILHDDGTVELGSAIAPFVSNGIIRFETPNQDNSLQVAVTIASDGTPTLASTVTVTSSGAPSYDSSYTVNSTTIAVRFSEKVQGTNFASGVVIKKNTVSQTISSATRQSDHALVYFVLDTAFDQDDTLTWEYAKSSGNIGDETDNTLLENVSAKTVTNTLAPAYSSSEVGTVEDSTVVVTFNSNVAASNFATGVTIKVATVTKTISSATRQADHKVVHYVIAADVTNGQAVTWEYTGGNIVGEVSGTALPTVTAQTVTNNVS